MLGKPCILSLFPNSYNKFNTKEHSYKILFNFKCIHSNTEFEITIYAHHTFLYLSLHVELFIVYSLIILNERKRNLYTRRGKGIGFFNNLIFLYYAKCTDSSKIVGDDNGSEKKNLRPLASINNYRRLVFMHVIVTKTPNLLSRYLYVYFGYFHSAVDTAMYVSLS